MNIRLTTGVSYSVHWQEIATVRNGQYMSIWRRLVQKIT